MGSTKYPLVFLLIDLNSTSLLNVNKNWSGYDCSSNYLVSSDT